MSRLQGQSTLTNDEKVTEARTHVDALKPHLAAMAPNEQALVRKLAENFEKYGTRTFISNAQLFWLRDIRMNF
jgi:hypothetical protein